MHHVDGRLSLACQFLDRLFEALLDPPVIERHRPLCTADNRGGDTGELLQLVAKKIRFPECR